MPWQPLRGSFSLCTQHCLFKCAVATVLWHLQSENNDGDVCCSVEFLLGFVIRVVQLNGLRGRHGSARHGAASAFRKCFLLYRATLIF